MKIFVMASLAILSLGACTATQKTTGKQTKPAMGEKTLENTYWVLTELNGKAVAPVKEGAKPNFIYFNSEKKRVNLSGGCNMMGGGYTLEPGNQIKFSQMMSTMMACPDMATEDALKKMTEMVDNYSINGDNLSFAKARMAPAARFKATPIPEGMKLD